jgi:hypothetical protein
MAGYAVWFEKRTKYLYEVDERSPKTVIGKFVIVYLEDILIYSKSEAKHLNHLAIVMRKLQQEKLLINMKKCSFMKTDLIYLGFVITVN